MNWTRAMNEAEYQAREHEGHRFRVVGFYRNGRWSYEVRYAGEVE